MKRAVLYICLALVAAAALVIGWIFLSNTNKPETKLSRFLSSQSQLNQISLEGNFSNDNSDIKLKYLFNSSNRELNLFRTVQCKSVHNGNSIFLNASVYAKNGLQYIRLDNVGGVVQSGSESGRDTTKVFAKVKGSWYSVPETEAVVYSAQKYGIMAIDSGIIDSNVSGEKIAKNLLDSNAMSITETTKTNGATLSTVVLTKTGWQTVLSDLYGNQKLEREQLNAIFDTKPTKTVKIHGMNSNGTFTSLETSNHNYCKDLFTAFMGIKPTDQDGQVQGTIQPNATGDFQTINVDNSKPLSNLAKDLSL